jgi:hypothetical protein
MLTIIQIRQKSTLFKPFFLINNVLKVNICYSFFTKHNNLQLLKLNFQILLSNLYVKVMIYTGLTQKSSESLIYLTAKKPRTPRFRRACVSPITYKKCFLIPRATETVVSTNSGITQFSNSLIFIAPSLVVCHALFVRWKFEPQRHKEHEERN